MKSLQELKESIGREFDAKFGPQLFDPKEQEEELAAYVDLYAPYKKFIESVIEKTAHTTLQAVLPEEIKEGRGWLSVADGYNQCRQTIITKAKEMGIDI